MNSPAPGPRSRRLRQRAEKIRDFLTARGVDLGRIEVAGRGEAEPLAANDTDAGKTMNRRVELIIFYDR